MPQCAAPNCTSQDASYRFPSDPERRRKWTINCRRDKWTAKPSDRLCIKHSLQRESGAKGARWSDNTILTSLKIRFTSGKHGYEHLRRLSYPLPSYRTLCERVMSMKFSAGIQTAILDWTAMKVNSMLDMDKYCVLALDEIQMAQGIEFDTGLKTFVGYISPEFTSNKDETFASHALCFMLKGLATKWKQVIDCKVSKKHFTFYVKSFCSSVNITLSHVQ